MSAALDPGTVIDQRFVIEAVAGHGGMGTVYRGRDVTNGYTVAVKLLHSNAYGRDDTERFAREVQILSELSHPGIVSYVAHGVLAGGQPYLVMEWLHGEELAQRLRRNPMSPSESLLLIRRVAEALAVAHQRNIIHRDLKPSNLFLRNGDPDLVTILDFGTARRAALLTPISQTGLVIGTPEYMAPEQARGQRDIEASADVFSLGCVLFECLTGQPPFVADAIASVLAKILFEPPPPVRSLHPGIPESVEKLLLRMLEKEPAARLQNAGQLLEALTALEGDAGVLATLGAPRTLRMREPAPSAEQKLVSVLISSIPSLLPAWDSDTTMASPSSSVPLRGLQSELEAFGATVDVLPDGSIVGVLMQRSHMTATDQVGQAARSALALAQRFPDSLSTLTTGRALLGGRLPLGEAFERSTRLRKVALNADNRSTLETGEIILLDGVTAGLLDARFEVRRLSAGAFILRGERMSVDETKSLLGQPTPCVGRDRELATLDLLFAECKDDSLARVALVLAPAGMGKSRLGHEFRRRLRARHGAVRTLVGRGDPLLMGSPYALLGQVVAALCGIQPGDDAAAQQTKLWNHVRQRVADSECRRVVEFLGAPCGLGIPDPDSVPLRAARDDARIMTDQLHRAFVDILRAECAAGPLLIVLEDLHWADALTVRLINTALRELSEYPLMVLALARPEIESLFPNLWSEHRSQVLRLSGLSKKASERLVRQVLSTSASASAVTRIVEQSAGNPLFLEELVRAVAEGNGDELPETVLAMLQSRLLRLEPGPRRLLRAASIFGQTFWRGGLSLLLQTEPGALDIDRCVEQLVDAEILETQIESRFPAEPQYRFRHALLRDAAYSLLTIEHLQLGHRLAAQYLEQMDDSDPVVLAEHCERGNDLARAGSLYLRAAEQAHRRGDADSAVARARRGLECGPDELARLGLLVVLCQVHLWRNSWAQAAEFAEEVMRLSTPGSPSWVIAATAKLVNARNADRHQFLSALEAIRQVEPEIDAMSTMAFALAIGIYLLDSAGEFALASSCLTRLHEIVDPVADFNTIARAWMNRAHAHHESWVNEDPWAGLCYSEATQSSFLEANHTRGALDAQVFIAMNAWYLGAGDRAERELRATLAMGEDLGLLSSLRTMLLIQVLGERGELAEAERAAVSLFETTQTTSLLRGRGLWALGEVRYQRRSHDEAAMLLREALKALGEAPLDRIAAQATLVRALHEGGRSAEAVMCAEEALREGERLGSFGFRGARLYLAYAEALDALGNRPQARQVIEQALGRLAEQYDKISDLSFRQSFLRGVPEHRRLIELAADWDGRAPA